MKGQHIPLFIAALVAAGCMGSTGARVDRGSAYNRDILLPHLSAGTPAVSPL